MNTLIDFIMDNLFFVLIIFFALSSLLGKLRGAAQQQQQEQPAPPQKQPARRTGEQPMRTSSEPTRSPARRLPPIEKTMEAERRPDYLIQQPEQPARTPSTDPVRRSAGKQQPEASGPRFTPNHAVQGMIWSQVFDRPRARNPHRWRR